MFAMFGRKRQNIKPNQMPANGSYGNVYAPYNVNMSYSPEMRQQPYMNYAGAQPNWNEAVPPYQGQNYPGAFPFQAGPMNNIQQGYPTQQQYHGMEMNQYGGGYGQPSPSVFQNPLEPMNEPLQKNAQPQASYPYMNPYPKQSFVTKQPSGVQSIMNSFKSQDGSLDFNKMMDTAGQMMNAVNQVSSMVKGVGGFFKV